MAARWEVARNLHYVHVHRDKGRTCRACHEVHAAKQERRVRENVPYGSKGWILPINFTKTPTGGTCVRTCHDTRSYSRTEPLNGPGGEGERK